MKTKKFYPQISEEQVNEAIQTPDSSAYPEPISNKKIQMEKKELRNRIIGMIILTPLAVYFGMAIIINVFQPGFFAVHDIGDRVIVGILFLVLALPLIAVIPPAKKWNEFINRVIRHFYSTLCVEQKTGDLKTYLVLAPNTMLQVSEDEFIKSWDEFDQTIETEVKTQEHATCTECGQKHEGLWAVSKYWFKDYFLEESLLLLRCPNCEHAFCSKCYVNLKDRHTCPKCGKKMKEIAPKIFGEGLDTFIPNPKLFKQAYISGIKVDQNSDNSADILCEVIYNYKYEDIIESGSGSTLNKIELGERGKLTCQFTNKAIKIGNDWRIIGANPGVLQTD